MMMHFTYLGIGGAVDQVWASANMLSSHKPLLTEDRSASIECDVPRVRILFFFSTESGRMKRGRGAVSSGDGPAGEKNQGRTGLFPKLDIEPLNPNKTVSA